MYLTPVTNVIKISGNLLQYLLFLGFKYRCKLLWCHGKILRYLSLPPFNNVIKCLCHCNSQPFYANYCSTCININTLKVVCIDDKVLYKISSSIYTTFVNLYLYIYHSNYHRMAVNYNGINIVQHRSMVVNLNTSLTCHGTTVNYSDILTQEKIGTVINYCLF